MNTAQFRELITATIIQPNYIEEISTFIRGRNRWRSIGMFFETLSKVCIGSGSVLSFSSGVYNSTNMSFVAGSVSTIFFVFFLIFFFFFLELKKKNKEIKIFFKKKKNNNLYSFFEKKLNINYKNKKQI